MVQYLPFPFNLIAQAFLGAVQTFVVPKITNAQTRLLVSEVVNFLLTGTWGPALVAAAKAHAEFHAAPDQVSVAQAPDLKKS